MPRHPQVSPRVASLRAGVFSRLAHKIATLEGERYPLHVGDTWLEPMVGARVEDFQVSVHDGLHRYAKPHGHPELLAAIERRRGVGRERLLVTAGATGGLGALATALLDPGDEVMILAPYWPLIPGIVHTSGGTPVDVAWFGAPGTVQERLRAGLSSKTVAIYVNTPSNPTGDVMSREDLDAIVSFAREHDLWIWADDIYEDYAYEGEHIRLGELAPERCFTACSFSKAYGMAGNRCGYLVGPADSAIMVEIRKASLHTFYSAPTVAQLAGARVLRDGDDWLAEAAEHYRRAGDAAADALGLARPQGGTFLFIDVARFLDERGLHGFLVDCLDDNLLLAPGTACGKAYGSHVRLCFTSAAPEVVARGVARLARRLGR